MGILAKNHKTMKIVDIREVTFSDSFIGAGTFGSVELISGEVVYSNKTSRVDLFAKKTFKGRVDYEREKAINLYIRTATIKNKIECLATTIFCIDSRLELLIEYVSGQTLHDYVTEYCKVYGTLSINVLHHLLTETLNAINKLHSIKIIHYDIKANNIMVNEKLKVVIIDFSLSSRVGDKIFGYQNMTNYQPPEVAKEHIAAESIDVFSLGVCFINILRNDQNRIFDLNFNYDYAKINGDIEKGVKLYTPNDRLLFNAVKGFLLKCINKDTKERPIIKDVFLPVFDGSQNLKKHPQSFFSILKCKLVSKLWTLDETCKKIAKKYETIKQNLQAKSKECEQHTAENRQLKAQLESEKQKVSILETQLDVEKVRNFLKDDEIMTLSKQFDANMQQLHSIKNDYDAITQRNCELLDKMEILRTQSMSNNHEIDSYQQEIQEYNHMEVDSDDIEDIIINPMDICDYKMMEQSESQDQKVLDRSTEDEHLEGTIEEGTIEEGTIDEGPTSNGEMQTYPP